MFRKWILISLSLILCVSLSANTHEGYPQTINTINQAYYTTITVESGITLTDGDIDLTGTATNRILLPTNNDATAPTLAWGDGDDGIYQNADNNLTVALNGSIHTQFLADRISFANSGFPVILRETASATNPTLLPRQDLDTGIGGTADALSLIAGGVEAHRMTEAAGVITHLYQGLTTQFTSETVADDAEIVIATGVSGWGECMAGDNEAFTHFTFTSAGVVTLYSDVGSVVNTDTDGNLCIYDAGSGIAIKNRLGSSKIIAFEINYK
jgi:hypothetical protein